MMMMTWMAGAEKDRWEVIERGGGTKVGPELKG